VSPKQKTKPYIWYSSDYHGLTRFVSFEKSVPLELIMAKLNHANLSMTKRYLGITDDELCAIVEGLNL
jgi:hypothetical protein